MKQLAFPFLIAALALAGCSSGGVGHAKNSPFAPPIATRGHHSVDGLEVGHRLMAAGEYELAIKAYYRAAAHVGINADVLSALGSANIKLGRLGQAEKLLRQAIKKDEIFAAAWNNLGVVLMEKGKFAEAKLLFHKAYALDSGESDSIRDNLRLAIAKTENNSYTEENNSDFSLVRRGSSTYQLLSTP